MNLYELSSNFWRIDEQKSFSGNETRLYFFLIHLANRSFWSEWIEFADKKMIANVGISLQVLKSARERLKESELLDFVAGGGFRVKTKYQIMIPKSTPKLSPIPYNNIKDKNTNNKDYGKRKGFIHSGSDFD
jgi:hypothetical protein